MDRAYRAARRRMVKRQLESRDIRDRRVLAAMARIPREWFVSREVAGHAYDDAPLPIGYEQTISQPYIVALMTQAAALTRRSAVLEVGTGTGYHTAVLATIARHVWSMERIASLQREAAERLHRLGIENVTLVVGDGATGHPDAAPYDAILVAAAAPHPPAPLVAQLGPGGRLVIPIGNLDYQELTVFERQGDGLRQRTVSGCRFVPLVSPEAFE